MSVIDVTASFSKIPRTRLPEFRQLAAEALRIATTEPRILRYEWFLDETQTRCVVLETYADQAALLEHMTRIGDVFARLIEVGGGCDLALFGDVPDLPVAVIPGLRRSIFRLPFQPLDPLPGRHASHLQGRRPALLGHKGAAAGRWRTVERGSQATLHLVAVIFVTGSFRDLPDAVAQTLAEPGPTLRSVGRPLF